MARSANIDDVRDYPLNRGKSEEELTIAFATAKLMDLSSSLFNISRTFESRSQGESKSQSYVEAVYKKIQEPVNTLSNTSKGLAALSLFVVGAAAGALAAKRV